MDSTSEKTQWFHIGKYSEATKQIRIRDGDELILWLDKIFHMMEIMQF